MEGSTGHSRCHRSEDEFETVVRRYPSVVLEPLSNKIDLVTANGTEQELWRLSELCTRVVSSGRVRRTPCAALGDGKMTKGNIDKREQPTTKTGARRNWTGLTPK